MTDIAILTKDGQTRRVEDGSEEYFHLVEVEGWDIYDLIPELGSAALWADGSPITAEDAERRPEDVKVREQLAELTAACDSLGFLAYEAESYGSRYLMVEAAGRTLKIRVAHHAKLSAMHDAPDFNIAPLRDAVEAVVSALRSMKG